MATFDRSYGTAAGRTDADARVVRHMFLDWSALWGGSLIGWGVLMLLSLVAMIAGLAILDPFAARPAVSNVGAGIWGAASAVIASFIGGFAIVRLAGDRRRGESLVHGAVGWGLSMMLAGLIALFASGAAAFSRTPVNNTRGPHRSARGQTAALIETTGNGPLVAIFATGGALLALVGSMLGSLAAASRSSGVPFSDEFRLRRRMNGHHRESMIATPSEVDRDQTTILPPTH